MEVIGGQDKKRQMDKNNSVNTNAATSAWLAFFLSLLEKLNTIIQIILNWIMIGWEMAEWVRRVWRKCHKVKELSHILAIN